MGIKISNSITINNKKIVIIGTNGSGKSKLLQELRNKLKNSRFVPTERGVRIMLSTLKEKKTRYVEFGMSDKGSLSDADKVFISSLMRKDHQELLKLRKAGKHTSNGKNYITQFNDVIKKVLPEFFENRSKDFNLEEFNLEKADDDYGLKIFKACSDGEKQVIILICAVLSVEENSILLIDEPESGLHNATLKILFDELENERKDCTFIYATHNLDFAKTREDAAIIYLSRNKKSQATELRVIESKDPFEKDLLIEMNGVSKPIMLVEGKNTDENLYSKIFKEYEVRSGGGCGEITNQVKAVGAFFKRKDVIGLIDGDNKEQYEDAKLKKEGIFSIPLAQHEHLFILPNILQQYLDDVGKKDKKALDIVLDLIKISNDYSRYDENAESELISKIKSMAENIKTETDVIEFLKLYRGKDLIGKIKEKIGVNNFKDNMINKPNIVKLIGEYIKDSLEKDMDKYIKDSVK